MIVYDSNPYLRVVPFQDPTLPQQSSPFPIVSTCPWCCPVEGASTSCSYQPIPRNAGWSWATNYCYGLVRQGQLEKTAWPY